MVGIADGKNDPVDQKGYRSLGETLDFLVKVDF
jgi:hypothetical protein